MNQNLTNQVERPIYDRTFEERKRFGDRAEDCLYEYFKSKYDKSEITYRQKEKEVDYKLPDFAIRPSKKTAFDVEVKTTSKIKLRDFEYQYAYAVKNNLKVYFVYVSILENNLITFRPIEIRRLLDYRVFDSDGVYQDPIPKAYFMIDWNKQFHYEEENGWFDFLLPPDFLTS